MRIQYNNSGKDADRDTYVAKQGELNKAYGEFGKVLPEFNRLDKLNTNLTKDLNTAKAAYDKNLKLKDVSDRKKKESDRLKINADFKRAREDKDAVAAEM